MNLQTTFSLVLHSKYLFWSIILIFPVVTFNFYSPDYNIGLDTSYAWAYNSLLLNKFSSLQKIVYPYGLLGFLKMPFPYFNLYLSFYIVVFLAKSFFCYLFLKTICNKSSLFILISILNLFYCCDYLYTDYILLGSLLLLLINQFYSFNNYFFILASMLILAGMLIKVNIMISGIMLYFAAFFITVVFGKHRKKQLFNYLFGIIIFLFFAILFYGGISNFATFLKGSFILSNGYNEALCTNNEVNFVYFIPFFLLLLFLISNCLWQKKYIELILSIFLFFAWKHTVVRLDSGHYYNIIMSLVLFTSLWVAISIKHHLIKYGLSIVCIVCFFCVGKNLSIFPDGMQLRNGLKEFAYTVKNFKSILQNCDSIVQLNYSKSILPEEAKNIILNSKIDAYPWELSYFNDTSLNYTPRYTLQSGSNSSWLDNYSKKSIQDQSIDYYILHYTNSGKNKFMNIDNRYYFNDEPITMMHLMSNYKAVYRNQTYVLLKRTNNSKFFYEKTSEAYYTKFNNWVLVDGNRNYILRLKIEFEKPLQYRLKSFIYKPSIFYITYKFIDDSITEKIRFVPANAKDGLWINPFYFDFNTTKFVKAIKLQSNDKLFDSALITLRLDSYVINKDLISSSDSIFSINKP